MAKPSVMRWDLNTCQWKKRGEKATWCLMFFSALLGKKYFFWLGHLALESHHLVAASRARSWRFLTHSAFWVMVRMWKFWTLVTWTAKHFSSYCSSSKTSFKEAVDRFAWTSCSSPSDKAGVFSGATAFKMVRIPHQGNKDKECRIVRQTNCRIGL